MIIRIVASSRSIEIDDPKNFKAFAVRIEGSFDDPAVVASLLDRVAVTCDREHAWISEKVLREWPQLSALSGLDMAFLAKQPFRTAGIPSHLTRA